MNKHKFGLYEQDEYDPLKEQNRMQECYDAFWLFPEQTIEDVASQAIPYNVSLRSRSVAFF